MASATAAIALATATSAAKQATALPPPSVYIFRHSLGVLTPGQPFINAFRSLFLFQQQRERKQRKLYLEECLLGDDDAEGARGFSVAEKLESSKFAQAGMVREMRGCDLTVS